jgi:hypothetical protein
MPRIGAWLAIAGMLVVASSMNVGADNDGKLIPVKPGYQQAAYAPGKGPDAKRTLTDREPTPGDQMYVFYYLGKALSYPIDKVESVIFGSKEKKKKKIAAPAVDPFEATRLKQVPPAPPARKGAAVQAQQQDRADRR